MVMGDLNGALAHGAAAVEASAESGDRHQLAGALSFDALFLRYSGRDAEPALAEALALEADLDDVLPIYSPTIVKGLTLMYDGDFDGAEQLLTAARTEIERQGNEVALAQLLVHLCELEWRSGDWQLAHEHAQMGLDLAQQLGGKQSESTMLYCTALVAAGIGDADHAGRSAAEGARLAREANDFLYETQNQATLGFLDISEGRYRDAAVRLDPILDGLTARGWREPALFGSIWPDAIEALARDGNAARATTHLATFSELVDARPTAWGQGAAARCRALVEATGGDLAAARDHAAAALALHETTGQPLEHARTLLVGGMVERRAKRRRDARDLLTRSRSITESLGARLWADRATEELGRIGGRSSPVDELTPTERRVAARAAAGETNREIAEAEFMSVKTVESNLSRVYRKLGLTSRSELRRTWGGDDAKQT